jgi:hypothetical protein
MAGVLDSRLRGEPFLERSVKTLRARLIVTRQACIQLKEIIPARLETGIDVRGLARAMHKKGRSREKSEGKGDLDDNERVAREKFPAPAEPHLRPGVP